MRLPLRLAPFLLLTTSCGLMLDFAEDGTPAEGGPATSTSAAGNPGAISSSGSTGPGSPGSGGEGGAGGASGAGGEGGKGGEGGQGGAPTSLVWANRFWASERGAHTKIRTMVVDGETTWLAGYFAGESLRRASPDGTEEDVFVPSDDSPEATSFVLALDASGEITARIPIARSSTDEYPTDEFLGTSILPAGDGSLFMVTAYRRGGLLLGGVSGSDAAGIGHGWNLVVARVEADGGARWAMRCAATPSDAKSFAADLSGAFAGLTLVDEVLMVGTSYSLGTASIECEALVGDATPCSADSLGPMQAALVFAVAPDDGACAPSPLHIRAPSHSLWLDNLRPAANGEVFVSGHVVGDGAVLEPWGAELSGGDAIAFHAPLGIDGQGDGADVESYVTNGYPAVAGVDGVAAGSPRNTAAASDAAIFVGDRTLTLGDPTDRTRSEVATSVSVQGEDILLTGYMMEDASMQRDLCGDGCEGDLAELDPCATSTAGDQLPVCEQEGDETCEAPGIAERDAYWVVVADTESAPRAAIGRAFGACGDQTIVAGHLGTDTLALLVEMEGSATIDALDGELPVSIPDGRTGSVVVQMSRPFPAR